MRVRRAKRDRILEEGREAYPVEVGITHTLKQVREEWQGLEAGAMTDDVVGVAGRIMHLRDTGKLVFLTLQDGNGLRLQIMVSQKAIGADAMAQLKADVDLGDHFFARGKVGVSKRGELSVFAQEWALAAKALRPLPTLHKDLTERVRVRQRYIDLITRDEAREMVHTRAEMMRALREELHNREYVEVETPMLQVQHGGAAARPFATHMNAYDMDLYLRIAPELFLKRAVVGGVERVFEINRNFRNEGADSSHSPEFAMLEAYEAYSDYNGMADLTQDVVQQAALDVFGSTRLTLADGSEYDVGGDWARIGLYDSLSEALGEKITPQTPIEELIIHAERVGLEIDKSLAIPGKVVEEVWEFLVGDHLHEPTFVMDYPEDTSPLTRQHRSEPGKAEKWDLYVRGFELATAYSELVDPVIQRERFEAQSRLAAKGDPEAMQLDEDFLEAMEYAMPPSGGMGMGMDRLLMALTGLGIRETITFPLVKPR